MISKETTDVLAVEGKEKPTSLFDDASADRRFPSRIAEEAGRNGY